MREIDFRNDILPLKDSLFRLALRITLNKAEAEDVVQDTLMRVWKRREAMKEVEQIDAFCYTICRNLALDKMKRAEWRSRAISADGGEQVEAPDLSWNANPERRTEQHDRVNLVRMIINQLPEKQRTAVQLRDFEGMSYKEIAEVMGITEEQVKVNIFRARQTIKKKFIETESYGL